MKKKYTLIVIGCIIVLIGALLFSEQKAGDTGVLSGESDFVTVGTDRDSDVSEWVTDSGSTSSAVTEGDTDVVDGTVVFGEYYYDVDDVACYLHLYGELPENYITKQEAQALGWISSEGNLWEVAPGMCIGGDRFGNYEGLLPTTGTYTECDVNYEGGYRTGERLVFDGEGGIWYTGDHYETFEQLYPQ